MPYCNVISVAAARSLGVRRPKVVVSAHTLSQGWRTESGRSAVSSRCMGVDDVVVPGITGELTGDSADDYAAAGRRASCDPVRDVEPSLRRFSYESSGGILRDALVRVANRKGGIES